jgi:hypothetical protein
MTVFSPRSYVAIATGLGLVGAWFAAVPRLVSASTFDVFAVLLIGAVSVSFTTWRNAQAVGSMGQLLQATETAGSPAPVAPRGPRK